MYIYRSNLYIYKDENADHIVFLAKKRKTHIIKININPYFKGLCKAVPMISNSKCKKFDKNFQKTVDIIYLHVYNTDRN